MIVSDVQVASLLLTNRLVDVGVKPYAAAEYWDLIARIPDLALLIGASVREVEQRANVTEVEAERIAGLLDAASAFAFERERLEEEGIVVVSNFDDRFPQRLIERLGRACPTFLTVAGPLEWLAQGGLGVVGSRDASADALQVARSAAGVAVAAGIPVISGLARGIDQASMAGALDIGGAVVGVPAEGLRKVSKSPEVRRRVHDGELCIASPYAPDARFTPGNAMGRNKVVYGLADITLVVCSDNGSGGTWEGAKEALRRGFGPVAVWDGAGAGPGNEPLTKLGGQAVQDVSKVLDVPAATPLVAVDSQESLF